jgi:predicted small metal-binding protein
MSKVLKCRDVGMDCDFVARGKTEEDVLKQAAKHAGTTHGMTKMSDEIIAKVRSAIHDE